MATTPEKFLFTDNRLFSRTRAEEKFGTTQLPPLPDCQQYDPGAVVKVRRTYVMSSEEERQRFLEWNYAKYRCNVELTKAALSLVGPQSKYRRREALGRARKWAARAMHLREYLARTNMPLVYSQVARNLQRYNALDWDEAVSEGQLPFMRALDKFNVDRGCKFSTYACRAILNSLSRSNAVAAKKRSKVRTVELVSAYGEIAPTGTDPLEDAKDRLRVALASGVLTAVEAKVINGRYALGGGEPKTLEQVGDTLGVTKERVRQIQLKGLAKLEKILRAA